MGFVFKACVPNLKRFTLRNITNIYILIFNTTPNVNRNRKRGPVVSSFHEGILCTCTYRADEVKGSKTVHVSFVSQIGGHT